MSKVQRGETPVLTPVWTRCERGGHTPPYNPPGRWHVRPVGGASGRRVNILISHCEVSGG